MLNSAHQAADGGQGGHAACLPPPSRIGMESSVLTKHQDLIPSSGRACPVAPGLSGPGGQGPRGPGRSTGPAQSSRSVCGTAGHGLAHGHSGLGAWRRVRPGTAGGPAHGICLFLLLRWFWFILPSSTWESGTEVEPALGAVAERAGTRGAGC